MQLVALRKKWEKDLESKAVEYLKNTVVPAFEKIREILERSERDVEIIEGKKYISIVASGEGKDKLSYNIEVGERPPQRDYPSGFVFVDAESWVGSSAASTGTRKKNMPLKPFEHRKPYTIEDISMDDIVRHFRKTFHFHLLVK